MQTKNTYDIADMIREGDGDLSSTARKQKRAQQQHRVKAKLRAVKNARNFGVGDFADFDDLEEF